LQGLDAATQFANNNNSYSGHARSNDSYGNCRSVRANLMACAPCTRLLFLVMLSLHLLFVVHACEQCEIDHAESQADGAVAGCVDAWDECDDPETAQVEGCEGDPPEFLCPALLGSGLCDTTFGEALPELARASAGHFRGSLPRAEGVAALPEVVRPVRARRARAGRARAGYPPHPSAAAATTATSATGQHAQSRAAPAAEAIGEGPSAQASQQRPNAQHRRPNGKGTRRALTSKRETKLEIKKKPFN
jgi:hypothetical protein